MESGEASCLLCPLRQSFEKKTRCERRSSVTLQYLTREVPASRRRCCGGDVPLAFRASPAIHPPPAPLPAPGARAPLPLCAAAVRRGASGLGEVPLPRARALATCPPSLPPFINGKPEKLARPAGVRARGGPGFDFPCPARVAFSLGAEPLGGVRRPPGAAGLPGAPSWAAAWRLPA